MVMIVDTGPATDGTAVAFSGRNTGLYVLVPKPERPPGDGTVRLVLNTYGGVVNVGSGKREFGKVVVTRGKVVVDDGDSGLSDNASVVVVVLGLEVNG